MRRSVLLLVLLLCAIPAWAGIVNLSIDLPKLAPVDVDDHIPVGAAAGKYDVAVLVGNRNYTNGVPNVDYAHNDVRVMREYLIRTMGYRPENILLEKDATKSKLEILFGTLARPDGKLADWIRPGKSKVFVYYVGHGAPDTKTGDGFLVPSDADPDYIATAGYPVSTFYANLKRLRARELVVVVDACFSGRTQNGLLLKNVSPAMLKVRETPAGISNGAVLTSSQSDQLSAWLPDKRHSLFTYYFLKGLQGAADANRDKRITAAEMAGYLKEEVPYWSRRTVGKRQDPKLEGRGDIVLAILK